MKGMVAITIAFAIVATGRLAAGGPAVLDLQLPALPGHNLAVGGGKTTTDIFNIAAHSGPLGENARGHLHAKNVNGYPIPFEIRGDVTCLTVVGNTATLGGILTQLEDPSLPNADQYHGFLFVVEDNGNQQGMPDRISYEFVTPLPPGDVCPVAPGGAIFPLTEGNVVVRGATP
jgi:hypothetical protein